MLILNNNFVHIIPGNYKEVWAQQHVNHTISNHDTSDDIYIYLLCERESHE